MRPLLRFLKTLVPDRSFIRLSWHASKAFLAACRYGFPARKLTVIGITGTDGKTTTSAMIAHILHAEGIRGGTVSTSFFRIHDKTTDNPSHKTSLSPFGLQSFLRDCVRTGCKIAVIECSSHGLVQHRLDWVWPKVAGITNLSPEHLDYHKTMEQYQADKGILFRKLHGKGTKIINSDDVTRDGYSKIPSEWTIQYSSNHPFVDTESKKECGLWAENISVSEKTSSATVRCNAEGGNFPLTLPIPGRFNIDNALCAIAAAHAVNIPLAKAVAALATFTGVPGRLERIEEGQDFSVYVDFTVTPASYEKTLATVKNSLAPGCRLLVMTGSCGNRMREKRPLIAKIVSSMADIMVITEDETVTEDPKRVMDDMWRGIVPGKCESFRIEIRREAMQFLLRHAKPGDAVMFCGMGACTTMQTLEGLRDWNEAEVARELLRELRTTKN